MAGSFALNDTDTGGVILFGLLMGTRPLSISPARLARTLFASRSPETLLPTRRQIVLGRSRAVDVR